MKKYAFVIAAAALALALALALPADPSGQTAQKTTISSQPSVLDYRNDAMQTFDSLFDDMTTLMASTSMEPTKTSKAWEDLVNDRCNLWSLTVDQAEIVMREKGQEPAASWQEWRKDNEEFIANEIQSAGKDVMTWRWKTYLEIFALQLDIDSHPIRKEEWLKDMTDAEKILETAEGTANDAAATVAAIERSRSDIQQAKNLVDNVASDLGHIRKRVLDFHGAELKMDSKIAAVQTRWTSLKDVYPRVITKWKDSLTGWSKNIKTAYDSHEKTRKQFDTLYEPVMNQKLFDGLKHFKGKEYKDLGGAVDKLDLTLQVRWVKAKDKSQKDEDIVKALEQEKLTTEKERKRYRELMEITGAYRAREEELKYGRIQDAKRAQDLQLKAARAKSPAEQKAADEEYQAFLKEALPDQVAVQKAWDDYQKQVKDGWAEMTKIEADRAARLKKLGLPSDPDWL
jgi:hypothetical protein